MRINHLKAVRALGAKGIAQSHAQRLNYAVIRCLRALVQGFSKSMYWLAKSSNALPKLDDFLRVAASSVAQLTVSVLRTAVSKSVHVRCYSLAFTSAALRFGHYQVVPHDHAVNGAHAGNAKDGVASRPARCTHHQKLMQMGAAEPARRQG